MLPQCGVAAAHSSETASSLAEMSGDKKPVVEILDIFRYHMAEDTHN
jgi:hypothetical protein